ncbi:MAG: hypothetical protein ACRDDY_03245 [Clostridium sp.]|uniref:hypothetical protein n=1 Tax=Clostridium sp. TaxID=1506 RepID=UPI003EE47A76
MKNVNEYVNIKNATDKNALHHEIELNHEKTDLLGDPKKHKIKEYFDKINEKELLKGNDSIYKEKDEKKTRILIPRTSLELKKLIDDLATVFGS